MGGAEKTQSSLLPMKRSIYACLILCSLSSVSGAGERAASLVNSFQVMCTIEPLDFKRSEEKATAMRLAVREDKNALPDKNGYFARAKSWLLPLKTGPHEFTVGLTYGPKGEVKSCGIGAPDVDGNDFRSELDKVEKLPTATSVTTSADGAMRTTTFPYGSSGLKLMLVDGTPKNRPGIYLFLLQTPE